MGTKICIEGSNLRYTSTTSPFAIATANQLRLENENEEHTGRRGRIECVRMHLQQGHCQPVPDPCNMSSGRSSL
ncbi:hypothetical protein QC762_0068890 [Podospora pseudocomata]|uniref:Uncharacterized protein n=2 Tax=Podospora TaxID=5144 RepID=A0ABR0GGJ8_9PEZI|nr:hypothetical protein QC762_0068890 [Podospora pseudocomata]KAK4677179.1 hypothetical protein QC764_0068100 [Podospora pseudoanserina]